MSSADWTRTSEHVMRHVSGGWVTKYLVGEKAVYVPFVGGEARENCDTAAKAKKIVEKGGQK